MKIRWKRTLSSLLAVALMASLLIVPAAADTDTTAEHTLWLVGDSTVCAFNDAYYYPRYGYGTQIGNYLDGTYKVENLALSGRSSLSFLSEQNYADLKAGIKAGDALIIGFGHNDEKPEDARYTNPNGTSTTEGSFAKNLYDNYVKLATDAGAEAILCTPIARRPATGVFKDSDLHKTTTNGKYEGGDYKQAIIDLGTEKSVPVVDLTTLTKALYEGKDPADTLCYHAWTSKKEASVDNTHLNIYGAKTVAYMLAEALKDTGTTLGQHVDLTAGAPTQRDLVSNPDYVEPDYDPNLPDSAWDDYTCTNLAQENGGLDTLTFKGTIFGDGVGDPSTTNFTLGADEEGNAHIAVRGNKGKIASASDGIAMYYLRLPVGTQFEFTAKAKLNQIEANNQVAFGLMARDDMYIDSIDAVNTDYVAAATLGNTNLCNSFNRLNGTLGGRAKFANGTTLEAGKTYVMSIVTNSDGYACTFHEEGKDESAQTGGYDFQLTTVDSYYFYIGMFAVRNVDVTFSDISLKITGGMPEVDTGMLHHAIDAGNGAAEITDVSADNGKDVSKTRMWVADSGTVEILEAAIIEAEGVLNRVGDAENAADQTAVDAAANKLFAAVGAFELSQKTGVKELADAIQEAEDAAAAVAESADGADVPSNKMWVTGEAMTAFKTAIATAKADMEAAGTEAAVDAAITALDDATKAFEAAQQEGAGRVEGGPDTTGLTNAIQDAKNALANENVVVSKYDNGTDVSLSKLWVTQDDVDALEKAIEDAEAALDSVTTDKDVAEAVEALEDAIETFKAAQKIGTYELGEAIAEAKTVLTSVKSVEEGSEPPKDEPWAAKDDYDTLKAAIEQAQADLEEIIENSATPEKVSEAAGLLNAALEAFIDKVQNLPSIEGPDTTALKDAITTAEKAAEAVAVSTNGSKVPRTSKWVTQEVMDVFKAAIQAAKDAVETAETEAEVAKALDDLNAASTEFKNAQKNGRMGSGSGSSGSSSSPGGSSSSGSSSGSSTSGESGTSGSTTTTTTSPDGTTTTTTTAQDGTTTATVTKTDGTKTETVTRTDGSKTETVTTPDGTVTETKTKTDGAKTETVKEAGGNVTVTATASDGEVVAKVEIPAVVPALGYSFEDVPTGHWAESAINTMAALSVVKGVSEESHVFDMNADITRGAMAQILFNLSNGKEGKVENFGDVAEGGVFTDAIAWAASAGVVNGYSESAFGPNDSITREQLAVMLYRYAGLLGLSTTASSTTLTDYTDADAVSSWSKEAMTWAVSSDLIKGKGEKNLDPAASASRAETAVILERFLDLVK